MFTLAAEAGVPAAQGNLGVMYAAGRGVVEDLIKAYKWLSIAEVHGFDGGSETRADLLERMTTAEIEEGERLVNEWVESHP